MKIFVKVVSGIFLTVPTMLFGPSFITTWMSNWDTIEPATGLISVLIGVPGAAAAVWFWLLPRYTAVVFHDGEQWFDEPGLWSERDDTVLYVQSECGRLFGGRVQEDQARMPRIPELRKYRTKMFGRERGIYRFVAVRIFPEGIARLQEIGKLPEFGKPVFQFQEKDENLSLK